MGVVTISILPFILLFLPVTAAKDLIARLLIVDRRKRYTAIDVLCHPWVITRGGSTRPSEPMDDHRRNLRRELELQATANRDSYVRSKVKNG